MFSKLNTLETAFTSILWGEIKKRFHLTGNNLQSVDIYFRIVVSLYKALILQVFIMKNMYNVYLMKQKQNSNKNIKTIKIELNGRINKNE